MKTLPSFTPRVSHWVALGYRVLPVSNKSPGVGDAGVRSYPSGSMVLSSPGLGISFERLGITPAEAKK